MCILYGPIGLILTWILINYRCYQKIQQTNVLSQSEELRNTIIKWGYYINILESKGGMLHK